MREIKYVEAISEALREEMARDKNVVVFGEDVAEHGGAFQATKGLFDEFGPKRVKNTPISEVAIVGAGIGAAAAGLQRPMDLHENGRQQDHLWQRAGGFHAGQLRHRRH